MFATSILENIRYGNPDASMEMVVEAARQANAHSFIETFPDQYHTVLGERGVTLSGGKIFTQIPAKKYITRVKYLNRSKTANRNR